MSQAAVEIRARSSLGIVDMVRALWAPRSTFARVEDVARYGWPLAILLACCALIGYATVQTGLIDREVDNRVQQRIAALDTAQRDVADRATLREQYEQVRKQGEFERTIMRIVAIVAQPIGTLATVLVISAVLFGAVAITGRKAEWHTLMTITVYATAVDILSMFVRFAFMLRFRTLEVDTSAALLVRASAGEGMALQQMAALSGLASAIDPFRIWFWVMVILGLSVTRQLTGWRAWVWCIACWLVAAIARTAMLAGSPGQPMA